MKVVTTLRFDLTLHSYYGENSDEVWVEKPLYTADKNGNKKNYEHLKSSKPVSNESRCL